MSAPSEVCQLAKNIVTNCGYPVFPCRLPKKLPARPKEEGGHGFKDASTDPKQIEWLWQNWPGDLIGIPTGEASGISILDIDVKHDTARAWWHQRQHMLPATRTFRTKSGGLHLAFRHADGIRNVEGKPVPGIDVRGTGGYFIYWFAAGFPCLDHSPPALWPQWLTAEIWPPRKPRYRAPLTAPSPDLDARLSAIRDRAVERVRNAPKGTGHDTLRAAARLLAGVPEFSDAEIQQWLGDVAGPWARVEETIQWGIERGRSEPLETR